MARAFDVHLPQDDLRAEGQSARVAGGIGRTGLQLEDGQRDGVDTGRGSRQRLQALGDQGVPVGWPKMGRGQLALPAAGA